MMLRGKFARGAALLILATLFWAPEAIARQTLGPGIGAGIQALEIRLREALPEGARLLGVNLPGDHLKIGIEVGPKGWSAAVYGPAGDCPPSRCHRTPQGRLFLPGDFPASLAAGLKRGLGEGPSLLRWIDVEEEVAQEVTDELRVTGPVFSIAEALAALKADDAMGARELLAPMLEQPERTPPGAYSLWLAAGGKSQGSPRAMLERFPLEGRLRVLMALEAKQRAEVGAASRHLARALRLEPLDGMALNEAEAQGWGTPETTAEIPAAPHSSPPTWPWQTAGLLALALLGWHSWRQKQRWTLLALFGAGVVAVTLPVGMGGKAPTVVDVVAGASLSSPCTYQDAGWVNERYLIVARCYGENHQVELKGSVTQREPFASTQHHSLILAKSSLRAPASSLKALVQHVEALERDGFRLGDPPDASIAETGDRLKARNAAEEAQLRVSAGLVALAFIVLLFALFRALQDLFNISLPSRQRRFLGLIILVLAALHLILPDRPIMVFEGYSMVEGLAAGEVPRYGAGGLFFYGWTQWFFGTDHHHIILLNRLLGLIALLLVLAWVHALNPKHPRRVLWSAALLLLLPVFARAHTSESILVAPTAAFFGALFLLSREGGRESVAGILLLGAAAISRPEMAAIGCFVPLWWIFNRREPGLLKALVRPKWLALYGLLLVVLWQALMVAGDMSARDALPATDKGLGPILAAMTVDGIFADPRCFSLILLVPGLWLLFKGETRRLGASTWLLIILWLGLTGTDHTSASTPRTHAPILLMALPLMAVGLDLLWDVLAQARHATRVAVSVAFTALLMAGSVHSAIVLHTPNNDDAEEGLWRSLVQEVEAPNACLLALGDYDLPDRGRTSRHNPEYLVSRARPSWHISPLAEAAKVVRTCEGRVFALLGMRCYTQIREPGQPVPSGSERHPSCARILETNDHRSIIERDIGNDDRMSHPMYPDGAILQIGVYELLSARTDAD